MNAAAEGAADFVLATNRQPCLGVVVHLPAFACASFCNSACRWLTIAS